MTYWHVLSQHTQAAHGRMRGQISEMTGPGSLYGSVCMALWWAAYVSVIAVWVVPQYYFNKALDWIESA